MRILGIDPGYATIGFGLIEGERAQYRMVTYGAITTPAGLPLSKRLYQIDRDMEELIGQLKPDVISVEELFFNTNITTGIAVAHGRGVLLRRWRCWAIPRKRCRWPSRAWMWRICRWRRSSARA